MTKDEEIRQVATQLDALLDELRTTVDSLTTILNQPPPEAERLVTSQ